MLCRCLAFQQPEGRDLLSAALRPGDDAAAKQGGGRHIRIHAQQGLPTAGHQPSGKRKKKIRI